MPFTSQSQRFWDVCWKAECVQQHTIWSVKTDCIVVVASLLDDWNHFWPTLQLALSSDEPAVYCQQGEHQANNCSHFPSLSPAEHVWDKLKQLQQQLHPPQTGSSSSGYLRVAEHPMGATEASYPILEAQISSCDQRMWCPHMSTELGHFQNDPMLTEVAEATIFDNDIILDLFWFSNSRMNFIYFIFY